MHRRLALIEKALRLARQDVNAGKWTAMDEEILIEFIGVQIDLIRQGR